MNLRLAVIGSRGYPYVYSGYETFVKELSERLVRTGCRVTVYNHRNLFARRPAVLNGIRLVYIPTIERKTLSQFLCSLQAVIHACLRGQDLLLVVNSANGPLGLIPKLLGKKTVINVDGIEWKRPKWRGLGSRYFRWASRWAARLFDAVVTDSRVMQKVYADEFHRSSTYIAYGADIRYSLDTGRLRRYGLRPGDYYLIVGRLIPDNNIGHMTREFCRTSSAKKLVVVGDVPYRDAYAREIKTGRDPRLVFTGYVRDSLDLAELYHGCYAYLHGHEFGGTNPSLLQALGCGCAVCALDTAFNREVLKDGLYGLFFNKIENGLSARIEDMENRPDMLENLRTKSRERITEEYTWDKVVRSYLSLFADVMGAGPGKYGRP